MTRVASSLITAVSCTLAIACLVPLSESDTSRRGIAEGTSDTPCVSPSWSDGRKILQQHLDEGAARPAAAIDGMGLTEQVSVYMTARQRKDVDAVFRLMEPRNQREDAVARSFYRTVFESESFSATAVIAIEPASDPPTTDRYFVFAAVTMRVGDRCIEDVIISQWHKRGAVWMLVPDMPRVVP